MGGQTLTPLSKGESLVTQKKSREGANDQSRNFRDGWPEEKKTGYKGNRNEKGSAAGR